MNVYQTRLKTGIKRTREFERKRLASHAVNVGVKCGHGCVYCSSGAMLRMHPAFREVGRSPFENDYAVIDPGTPDRVARDARRIRRRGMVQLCTTVDAWSPEAQKYDLGRRCLEAILAEPGWTVRILTKNAAVARDYDLIERHRDRVLVGLSITAPPDCEDAVSVIEPRASSGSARTRTKAMNIRRVETCDRYHRHIAAFGDGEIDCLLVLGRHGLRQVERVPDLSGHDAKHSSAVASPVRVAAFSPSGRIPVRISAAVLRIRSSDAASVFTSPS